MASVTESDTLSAVERWFRSRGIPHFIDHYSASRDVFTRALAPLTAILVLELVTALDSAWPWWLNLAVAAAGLGALLAVWAVVNVARKRPALARPDRVGPTELAIFVLLVPVLDLLAGGQRLTEGDLGRGLFAAPTVVQAPLGHRVWKEELFVPFVAVAPVDSIDEGLKLANDTEYGLSASVFTRDIARGLKVARRIQSGICHVNGPTVHDEAQMPFGGVKDSGYGRFGGLAGIDAFTELRWISMQVEPRVYPF